MPPGLPHQPLAMRLWLSRRSGRADGTNSAGHSSGRSMSIGSLEHMMRNRFRMFLRHTWLVTILGTIVLGGVVWAAFYYSTKNTVMRIATGPGSAKIVQVLANTLAKSHDRLQLQVVTTDSANASAQALNSGSCRSCHRPDHDRQIAGLARGRHPAAERDRADRAGARAGAHSGSSRRCRTGARQEGREPQGDQDRQAGKASEGDEDRQIDEDRQDRQRQG